MKKIVVFSSEYAGHGHKSLCSALRQEFERQMKNGKEPIEFIEVDGFAFGGKAGIMLEKQYMTTVTHFRPVWSLTFKATSDLKYVTNNMTGIAMKKAFLRVMKEEKPDLLVSVHASFIEPVKKTLQSKKMDVPMLTVVADLDNISSLWYSPRCEVYMCPSRESADMIDSFAYKVRNKEKIARGQENIISGLPVRGQFRELRDEAGANQARLISCECHPHVAMLCTTEKFRKVKSFLETFIDDPAHRDIKLTMVAGRNRYLHTNMKMLVQQKGWEDQVKVVGYCKDFYNLIVEQHIFVGKGGPNAIMECANIGVPMISTGTLPGQEAKNGEYVLNNNIGRTCDGILNCGQVIDSMLADNGKELVSIRNSQLELTKNSAAEIIVDKCYEMLG